MYRDCCGFKLTATESALWKKPTHWIVDFSTIKSRMWPFALIATQTWRYPLPMMTSEKKKHFCLDVNTNFCSQFFVGRHFDFVNIQKFTMVKWEWTLCVLWLLYGIFRLWRRCTHVSSYTYCTWNQSTYLYFYIMSFKLYLF